jgi:hypothetical protein
MVYKLQHILLFHSYLLKTSGDCKCPARPMKKRNSEHIVKLVIFYCIRGRKGLQITNFKHFSITPPGQDTTICSQSHMRHINMVHCIYWKARLFFCIKIGNIFIFFYFNLTLLSTGKTQLAWCVSDLVARATLYGDVTTSSFPAG